MHRRRVGQQRRRSRVRGDRLGLPESNGRGVGYFAGAKRSEVGGLGLGAVLRVLPRFETQHRPDDR